MRVTVLIVVLFLTGCGFVFRGKSIRTDAVREFKIGSTTKQNAIDAIGKPNLFLHPNPNDHWVYDGGMDFVIGIPAMFVTLVWEYPLNHTRVELAFDSQGTLTELKVVEENRTGEVPIRRRKHKARGTVGPSRRQ